MNVQRRVELLTKLASGVTPKALRQLKRLLKQSPGDARKVIADADNMGERFGSKGKALIATLTGLPGAALTARKGRGWASVGRLMGGHNAGRLAGAGIGAAAGSLGGPAGMGIGALVGNVAGSLGGSYAALRRVGSKDQITKLKAMRQLFGDDHHAAVTTSAR